MQCPRCVHHAAASRSRKRGTSGEGPASSPGILESGSFPLSCLVLFHPRFDQLLNERHRNLLLQRKADGCPGCFIILQLTFMFLDDWRGYIKSSVVFESRKIREPPFVAIVRHSVTDTFHGSRRGFPNCRPKFLKFDLHFLRSGRNVCVDAFWCGLFFRGGSLSSLWGQRIQFTKRGCINRAQPTM